MRKVFRNVQEEIVSEIQHSLKIIQKYPDCKIYVGSDSQNHRRVTKYATVIAYRYDTKGAHFIYNEELIRPKIRDIKQRLEKEIYKTMETVQFLLDNNISIYAVDFDFNDAEETESTKLVKMSTGWAQGLGLRTNVKPNELIATKAADHIVR